MKIMSRRIDPRATCFLERVVEDIERFIQQIGNRVDALLFEGFTCFRCNVENVFHDVLGAILFHVTCDGHRVGRCRSMDRVTGSSQELRMRATNQVGDSYESECEFQ